MSAKVLLHTLEQLADVPGGIRAFREIVLQLSVRGRLADQRSDESTRLQLDRVEEFRTRSRRELRFNDAVAPFTLPETWSWVAVGDTMEMFNGRAFRPEEWSSQGTPIIRIQNLNSSGATFNRCPADIDERFHVNDGDFLISWSGTPGTSFGAFIWDRGFAFLNQHIFRCELVAKVFTKEFLRLAINARLDEMISQAQGAVGLRHITKGKLEGIQLPLPPLAEQKRIVAKVDELMALCDCLEAQQKERETRHAALARASLARFSEAPTLANLTLLFHKSYTIPPADLRKSILTLAVQGKLVPRGSEAPFVSLESILAEASVNGVSKGPTSDASATEILRISAGTSRNDFYVDEDDFKYVDLPSSEVEKFRLAPGDLLACRFNGNLHYVGRFSLYRGKTGRVQVNPDKLIRFRVDARSCCPRYVCYAMNASPTRGSIEAMCATTAGNIGLSAGRLKTVKIPIPPFAEQRRIVAKVDQLMALVDELERKLAASRTAAAKLLDAIVGELTA